jgi:hypothetical protein
MEEVFTVKAADKLPDNFVSTSTGAKCFCTCGTFAAEVAATDLFAPPPGDDEDDFYVTACEGFGGSNFRFNPGSGSAKDDTHLRRRRSKKGIVYTYSMIIKY